MMDKYLLCVECRNTYDPIEVNGNGCPQCQTSFALADLRSKCNLTLSLHNWYILLVLARSYASYQDLSNLGSRIRLSRSVSSIVKAILDDCFIINHDFNSILYYDALRSLAEDDWNIRAEYIADTVARSSLYACSMRATLTIHEVRVLTFWSSTIFDRTNEKLRLVTEAEYDALLLAIQYQLPGISLTIEGAMRDEVKS